MSLSLLSFLPFRLLFSHWKKERPPLWHFSWLGAREWHHRVGACLWIRHALKIRPLWNLWLLFWLDVEFGKSLASPVLHLLLERWFL